MESLLNWLDNLDPFRKPIIFTIIYIVTPWAVLMTPVFIGAGVLRLWDWVKAKIINRNVR
jgi:hypothetical protein